MRVLVTGHRGYIGSVLASYLRRARYEVVGLDCDLYRGCDFGRMHEAIPSLEIDLRDVEFTDLLPFDAVIHLAALSDDALCKIDPGLTAEINHAATVRLADCCKQANVTRFLFASSCGVYGASDLSECDEQSPARPLTAYARSKLKCERDLAALQSAGFTPVLLRLGTAYGVSPRLRTDTVVNDFVASADTTGRIQMRSDGRAWRPVIHVEDVARTFAEMLQAPDELVRGEVFNVVRSDENYRVIEIADEVLEIYPYGSRGPNRTVTDNRTYRVSGAKLASAFPDLDLRWTLPLGVRQLQRAMVSSGMTPGEWRSDRYRRVLRLQALLEHGLLDSSLRHTQPADWDRTGLLAGRDQRGITPAPQSGLSGTTGSPAPRYGRRGHALHV